MEGTIQGNVHITGRMAHISLMRGLVWGLIGGLTGTLVMDLVLMAALSTFGLPALTCFSIVGNTTMRFLSIQNMDRTDAIRLGLAMHYLIGPLVGAGFGAVVARVGVFRVITLKKSIILAIIYVEILSQPLLAMAPILLKMTAPAILQWYGWSFVMHWILAVILGTVVSRGLRLSTTVNHR